MHVKTRYKDVCEKYCRIKIAYKHHKTIKNVSKRDDLIDLKQGKCRGIVLKDKNNCTKKYMSFLNTKQFKKLDNDPTKTAKARSRECREKLNPSYLNTNINFYIHLDCHQESFTAQLKFIHFPKMVT